MADETVQKRWVITKEFYNVQELCTKMATAIAESPIKVGIGDKNALQKEGSNFKT